MKIAIGCDHAGYELKLKVEEFLIKNNILFENFGTYTKDSVDYPDFVHPVGKAVNDGKVDLGIVLCGSANGVNMVVNKYINVRSAICWKKEIAELARQHNDANILALPARYLSVEDALEIVNVFLNTKFEGGRHLTRVNKIKNLL
ncbi:MAG: ribose 5-phosphate isomerase B [Bacteroidota bacterium]